jgi:type II secretory pathway component PulM
MKKYFAQLRPLERRLAIGVMVILLLVLNYVFIWPHFSDWGNLRRRSDDAQRKLKLYQTVIAQKPTYEAQVKGLESAGEFVPLEDQSVNMMRTIQSQSAQSGVGIVNTSRQMTRTNDAFFVEQIQNIQVQADDKSLVDFLYKLGSGASTIRVRDLELQADAAKQKLNGNIRLVASYQKGAPVADPKTAPAASPKITPVAGPKITSTATATNLKPATAKAK